MNLIYDNKINNICWLSDILFENNNTIIGYKIVSIDDKYIRLLYLKDYKHMPELKFINILKCNTNYNDVKSQSNINIKYSIKKRNTSNYYIIFNKNTKTFEQGCYSSLDCTMQGVNICVWDIKTGKLKYIIKDTCITNLEYYFICENYIVFASNYNNNIEYKIYDINTGKFIHSIPNIYEKKWITSFIPIIDVNGNNYVGRFLVCLSDGRICIYNASSGKMEFTYSNNTYYDVINKKITIMNPKNNEFYGKIICVSSYNVDVIDINNEGNIYCFASYDIFNSLYNGKTLESVTAVSNEYIIINHKHIIEKKYSITVMDIYSGNIFYNMDLYKSKFINNIKYMKNNLFIIEQDKQIDIWKIVDSKKEIIKIKTIKYNKYIVSTDILSYYMIINFCKFYDNYEPYGLSFNIYN
jgi:hypothetical protein